MSEEKEAQKRADLIEELLTAILMNQNIEEARAFFKDLCTPQELTSMAERWRVCKLLESGEYSYRQINALTGASLTTIGRVARFLKDEENNGYSTILRRMREENEAQ